MILPLASKSFPLSPDALYFRADQINHVILQLVLEARKKISSIETVPYLIPLSFRSKIRIFRIDDVRRFFKKKRKKKETWLVSRYRTTQKDKTELINFYELEILRR